MRDAGAVGVHHVDVVVRGTVIGVHETLENNPRSVGRPVGFDTVGEDPDPGAVRIHDRDPIRGDPGAVGRPRRVAVPSRAVGEVREAGAVGVHYPDVNARAPGDEDDLGTVRRPGGLDAGAGIAGGEADRTRAVGVHDVDLVAVIRIAVGDEGELARRPEMPGTRLRSERADRRRSGGVTIAAAGQYGRAEQETRFHAKPVHDDLPLNVHLFCAPRVISFAALRAVATAFAVATAWDGGYVSGAQ